MIPPATPSPMSPELAVDSLGALTVAAPLVAWGVLAGVIPVLIHLIFRERPRRELFPAMRFLLKSHASSTRAQRLRHLLLLLCRVLLILLVVGLLAKLGCTTGEDTSRPTLLASQAPAVSAVICIDDSASMGYRYQGRTRLQAATDWARSLIEDLRWFGPGSQFAVISGASQGSEPAWVSDLGTTRRAIDSVRVGQHGRGPASLLAEAYVLLATARHERREVYVFTDLTEASWRDPLPPVPEKLGGVYVMDVGQDENRNVALGWPEVPPRALPAGVATTLPIRLRSGDLAAGALLRLSVDGQARGQQAVEDLAPQQEVLVELPLPGLEAGTHAISIALEPSDALDCDNVRFACVSVGPLPRIALVREAPDNEVATSLSAMIAPPALVPGEQRYTITPMGPSDLDSVELTPFLVVILADVGRIEPGGWRRLADYVKGGGDLLVVPGPHITPEGYRGGEAVLPALIGPIGDCEPAVRPATVDFNHPFLRSFANPDVDSVNDRLVFRRVSLEQPAPGARTVLPFSDGAPAMLERSVGAGRSVVMAFSVARDWGQFGSQAGPTIVLLHTLLEALAPPAREVAGFAAGAPATWRLPEAPESQSLRLKADQEVEAAPLTHSTRQVTLPPRQPGTYRVLRGGQPPDTVLHYSVNVSQSESDQRRIAADSLKPQFSKDLAAILRPDEQLARTGPAGKGRMAWTVPVALALLALLIAESLFANRFYSIRPPQIPWKSGPDAA